MKISHKKILEKNLQNKDFKKEWDNLEAWRNLQIKLIDARIEANLTQEELAKRLNIKRSNLARFESNLTQNPTINSLINYARALGLDKIEINLA